MEQRLPNLFNYDSNKTYAWWHEKTIHTYQTDETENVFEEQIKHCFPKLNIDTPAIVKLYIYNDTANDELKYGDNTSQAYVVNNTDEFKELIKNTTEQLVGFMKNLIRNDEEKRIASWWVIKYRKYRNEGYKGEIAIHYSILGQPNKRGASTIYREYKYSLEFRTARKDFHI